MFRSAIVAAAILTSSIAFAQTAPAPANPLRPAPSATPPAQAAPPPTGKAVPSVDTPASTRAKTAKTGSGATRRTECSKRYQAAKASNTLGGVKWGQFYSKCNTELKAQGV